MDLSQNTNTFEEIRDAVNLCVNESKKIHFMTKEQLFAFVAATVELSNDLTNFVREQDKLISTAESQAIVTTPGEKPLNASMMSMRIKAASSKYRADKDWAEKQLLLVKDIRIATLAAQRSYE